MNLPQLEMTFEQKASLSAAVSKLASDDTFASRVVRMIKASLPMLTCDSVSELQLDLDLIDSSLLWQWKFRVDSWESERRRAAEKRKRRRAPHIRAVVRPASTGSPAMADPPAYLVASSVDLSCLSPASVATTPMNDDDFNDELDMRVDEQFNDAMRVLTA